MREIETKLKQYDREKVLHQSFLEDELENIKPIDLNDFSKNHDHIKRIRDFKNKLKESESCVKDIESIQKAVNKKVAEFDMENSIVLIGLKS